MAVDKKILLYSGGLDSFILRYSMSFDTIIHFEVGTEDEQQEKLLMDTGVEYISLPLQRFELPNKIIPFRNYLFVLMAANYGNRIYIGSTLGDTTRDKDWVFQSLCESVLNYFGAVKEKMPYEAEQFEVCMPFKDRTKTQIVASFLLFCDMSGYDISILKVSRSCYKGGERECGECRSCLRKYVAFKNNGVENLLDFSAPSRDQLIAFYEESIAKGRHEREIAEILRCLR